MNDISHDSDELVWLYSLTAAERSDLGYCVFRHFYVFQFGEGVVHKLNFVDIEFVREENNQRMLPLHGVTYLVSLPLFVFFKQVGLVYMFNLIIGTGALTMPKAFATAGWAVSLVLISFLGFMRSVHF